MGIGAVGIDLDRAIEAVEDFSGVFALSPGPVMEHHAGRRGAVPATIIAQHRPKVTCRRLPLARIQHRGGGLINIEPGAASQQLLGHVIDYGGDQGSGPAHPVGQHRAVDRYPMPRHHHSLPVQMR